MIILPSPFRSSVWHNFIQLVDNPLPWFYKLCAWCMNATGLLEEAFFTINWFWNCRLGYHLLLSSTNQQIHTLVSGTGCIIVFMHANNMFNHSLNPSWSLLSALCIIIIMIFVNYFSISAMAMMIIYIFLVSVFDFFLPVWTSKRSDLPNISFYRDKMISFCGVC